MTDQHNQELGLRAARQYAPAQLWTDLPFQAVVRGIDHAGKRFEERVVLQSLSSANLSLRLQRPLQIGDPLFVAIHLALQADAQPGLWLALRGRISFAYWRPKRGCILVIGFKHWRFLYREQP